MTINGTDFCIQQKGTAKKGNFFTLHKYTGKSGLQDKLGVNILAGNLIGIKGPYPAGRYTDIVIFNSVPTHCLEPGNCVKADNNYVGHLQKKQVHQQGLQPGGEPWDAVRSKVLSWDTQRVP
jgi:hypothetical protein